MHIDTHHIGRAFEQRVELRIIREQIRAHMCRKPELPGVLHQIGKILVQQRVADTSERHAGIVPVYDVGREGDLCYIVSQFVDGGTLSQLAATQQLTTARSLELIAKLAETIQFAHDQGWMHRDIKPSNVLIDESGKTYLTDFGLTDTMRIHHVGQGPYSWWDYRMLAFPKGDGVRIDHILATQPMADRCTNAWVDRDERKGKKPSDHAPVLAEFEG